MKKQSPDFYITLLINYFNVAYEKHSKQLYLDHAIQKQDLKEDAKELIWIEHHDTMPIPHAYMRLALSCDEIVRLVYSCAVSPEGNLQSECIKVVTLDDKNFSYGCA